MSSAKELVVVTGASGLIGYSTCERFADSFHVAGLDRPGIPHPPPTADRIDIDLTSDDSVTNAFKTISEKYGKRIASVIHLAAYYDFSGKPSAKYREITIDGTRRLLNVLRDFEVGQFIFSSTMLVHAPCHPGEKITETSSLAPKWDYPTSKVETEELIHQEKGDYPVVFLRIAGVYNDRCHSIPLANQIQRIYEKALTSHLFPGDMSHGQSFLHLKDLVDLFGLLVSHRRKLPAELALLAGEPDVLSYRELQETFGRLIHGKEWKTIRIPKLLAKAGAWLQDNLPFFPEPFIKPWMIDLADEHYDLDMSRAKSVVGWEPQRSLRATLPWMVAALKEDPQKWYKENKLEG